PGQYHGYATGPPPPPPLQPQPQAMPAGPTLAEPTPQPTSAGQPPKRKRGRPPKNQSSNGATSGSAAGSMPSSPKKKRARKGARKTDTVPSETESVSKRWPTKDRDKFYRFLLSFDAEGDKRFEQHKKNPGHVYDRASKKLFNGKRSADSIKGQWQRSLKTFEWIVAFESFTGNGGGDGDSDDVTAVLKGKLTGARAAGIAVGSLTPATIKEWDDNGWRDLFEERLGNSAKVTRPVVRNSAAPLSDVDDLGNESDDVEIDPVLKSQTKKTAAATVTEPKHASASKFRAQASHSLGNIGELVKVKMAADEKRAKALDAKLELDERRFRLESTRTKVDLARTVFSTDGVSAEVKNAANSFLLDYFTS
ncbi:hypothetical protein C8R43DRAFT_886355, partial [Mycena crocata]